MKQQFLVDIADTIRITIYDSNRAYIPSSGTITLYKPGGSVLQAATAVTVDATTGEMTYSLTSTHTDIADLNYKAVWAYVINGTTYYQTQLFDVVKSILSIPIIDTDLYAELDALREANHQATRTATAGAAGTLTDTFRREGDDFWKGGTIKILSGTGINQIRDVTGFTQSTGVFTISPNWTTNVDNTSVYLVIKSFSGKIQSAFNTLSTMIYNKGKRHSLILESSQIELPLLYLTIHIIALDIMGEEGDKWDRLSKIYSDKFDKAFNSMKLEYDEDESGSIVGDEEQSNPVSLRIGRA